MVAYQCAYLKAHYPAEFMAANLNSELGDIDRLVVLIDECRRMGLSLLPPDVNESGVDFRAVESPDASGSAPPGGRRNAVRMGMAAVRNVGRAAVEAIVKARESGGLFRSLFDFCERVDLRIVNRRAMESLVCAGALDPLEGHRGAMFSGLERAMEAAQSVQADRARGQFSLFGGTGAEGQSGLAVHHELPDTPLWSDRERLSREKEVLGFYLSGHPLQRHREEMRQIGVATVDQLESLPDGVSIKLGGMITEVKKHVDKTGRAMAFGTMEDLGGACELVVFPDVYERAKDHLLVDALGVMHGRKSGRNGRTSLQVEDVLPLDQAREKMADAVNVMLSGANLTEDRLKAIKGILARHQGGCSLLLHLEIDDQCRPVIRSRELKVMASTELVSEISESTGARVWLSAEGPRRGWRAAAER
jgi:DNA polymerase-3 subunit alpha